MNNIFEKAKILVERLIILNDCMISYNEIINLLAEQTDLKINDVVGLELFVETMEGGRSTRDISHPPLYGTVDIYLVHSHDLFLRDTIDAKGHQGVKGDTSM